MTPDIASCRHLGRLPAAALLLALWLMPVRNANAATYAVDACQRPDGQPTLSQGWASSTSGNFVSVSDRCSAKAGLEAAFDPASEHGAGATASWSFAAPLDTTLDQIGADRSALSAAGQPRGVPETFIRSDFASLERCSMTTACSSLNGRVDYALGGASMVTFGVACSGTPGASCPAGASSISLKMIRVALRDEAAPRFTSDPSGTLTVPASSARVRTVAYAASDVGGGLYRQQLLSDGAEVASAPIDENNGECVRYAVGGGFRSPVPCKLSASGEMSLDTAALADGEHQISLRVLDATDDNKAVASWPIVVDNVAPVISAVNVDGVAMEGQVLHCDATVAGQGTRLSYEWLRADSDGSGAVAIPRATGSSYLVAVQDVGRKLVCRVTATDGGGTSTATSAFETGSPATVVVASKDAVVVQPAAKTSGARPLAPLAVCKTARLMLGTAQRTLLRSYRRSGMTLTGRLTAIADGRALSGTSLDVLQTVTRAGTSRRTKVASTRTTTTGGFSIKVPLGPTRVLELRAAGCGAVGPKVTQRVRGAISARTTTRRIRNGQVARIRGHVLGGHFGRGLPLELQVKVGATWRDVKAVTTGATGDFRVAYRFRRTFVTYTYRFRVVSRGGSAWPYLRASSARIRVRVN